MAGFISFDDNQAELQWSSANWVYRAIIERAIAVVGDDEAVREELETGKDYQLLDVGELQSSEPEAALRMLQTLDVVCREAVSGQQIASVSGQPLDDEAQQQYRSAVAQLWETLRKYRTRISPDSH